MHNHQESEQEERPTQEKPNLIALFVVFPILLFFVLLVYSQSGILLNPWIVFSLGAGIVIYGIVRSLRKDLRQTLTTVHFNDYNIFLEKFISFLRRSGFKEKQLSETEYLLEIDPKAQIGFGNLRFPPKSWSTLRMEIQDTKAILRGPEFTVRWLNNRIRTYIRQEESLRLPY